MNIDKDELLSNVKALIEAELVRNSYTRWIKDLGIEAINDDKIVLIAQSIEQRDAVERKFIKLLVYAFKLVTNKDYKLEVILKA